MRNLVIDSIIKLWENRIDEFTRYLNWGHEEESVFEKFYYNQDGKWGNPQGTAGELYKLLIQLTDQDLLNILSSQHCLLYR
jgi:hypothetical protein